MRRRGKSKEAIDWVEAPDIMARVHELIDLLEISYVDPTRIYFVRSANASTRAIARIWGFSRLWQIVLKVPPMYCLEVVGEKFDRLNQKQKDHVLLHELAHIPKNFSGALLAHTRGKGGFHDKLKKMIMLYDKFLD